MPRVLSLITIGPQYEFVVAREGGPTLFSERYRADRQPLSKYVDHLLERILPHFSEGSDPERYVAVCPGPGSLTGIRIGIAIAQAVCRASGARLYSVNLGQALRALRVPGAGADSVIALDGRNGAFGFAPLSTGEFKFVLYQNCAQSVKRETQFLGYGDDLVKLENLLGPFTNRITLDALSLAEAMAEVLFQARNSLQLESLRYAGPAYGLEALTGGKPPKVE